MAKRKASASIEAQFDGLVGPTHNYAGLSYGNVASEKNQLSLSHPKEAALQGLAKMKTLLEMGVVQGVIPPQPRPYFELAKRLGYSGSDAAIQKQLAKKDPILLAACFSASAMWAANAATVAPSTDTEDGKVHFLPANLIATAHRSIEADWTSRLLRAIFKSKTYFVHHTPLPGAQSFSDEGAANHTRLCTGERAVHLFVYGRSSFHAGLPIPKKFPARQTLEASQAAANLLQVPQEDVIFAQQNPGVIDQGVFHNDVISVGHGHVFLFHEEAFVNSRELIENLRNKLGPELELIEVKSSEVSVSDAVTSYLFNSQILDHTLVVPIECQENPRVKNFLSRLTERSSIQKVIALNVRQSMRNGGGPACLRLRVPLQGRELSGIHRGAILNSQRIDQLCSSIDRYYPDQIHSENLADPKLIQLARKATRDIYRILGLSRLIT